MGLFENKKEKISVGEIDNLRLTLSHESVPIEEWGKGEAKTVEHLLREIKSGEAVLVKDGEGIVRQVTVVVLKVLYQEGGSKYELVEDRQEFTDGRIRQRNVGGSIGEKLSPGEKPHDGAIRALREELGLEGNAKIAAKGVEESRKESPSYPGLRTKYVRHFFEAQLRKDQFQPEGYVEHQSDKTTYFVWIRQ